MRLVCHLVTFTTHAMNMFSHLAALAIRYWMFVIFFWSGWLKINSWGDTVFLFTNEYKVKLLPLPPPLAGQFASSDIPPLIAAYMGTAAELLIPPLVILGIGGRLPAIALFLINYVAAVSYPYLWSSAGLVGLKDHYIWGLALAMLCFYGPGNISLDFMLKSRCKSYKY